MMVVGVEDGGIVDLILELAEESAEDEGPCPCCGEFDWLRAIASYMGGACWVVFCGGCGRPLEQRWNIIP
jgi:hypothetical protein